LQLMAEATTILVRQRDLFKLEPDSLCTLCIAHRHRQLSPGCERSGMVNRVKCFLPGERFVEDQGGRLIVGVCVAQKGCVCNRGGQSRLLRLIPAAIHLRFITIDVKQHISSWIKHMEAGLTLPDPRNSREAGGWDFAVPFSQSIREHPVIGE
jgi:hypothetical protein